MSSLAERAEALVLPTPLLPPTPAMSNVNSPKLIGTATGLLLCSLTSFGLNAQQVSNPLLPAAEPARAPASEAGPGVTVAGGEVRILPIESRDQSPRLPNPAVVRASDDGDMLIEPKSGDPYFLGFAAGAYYPPEGERIDPELIAAISTERRDGRPTPETYAYVMLQGRITEDVVGKLEARGARVLGYHPSNSLKVAVRTAAALNLSEMPEVRWIGVPKDWQKMHPVLSRELAGKFEDPHAEDVDIYISVYDSDLNEKSVSEAVGSARILDPQGLRVAPEESLPLRTRSRGWQEDGLRSRGAQDPIYIDRVRAFKTRVHPQAIASLRELDYVAFIELAGAAQSMHEESMPMVNADRGRTVYDGGFNGAAVIGEADWGVDVSHFGLNGFYGWGWNLGPGSQGAWEDACGHGSHVAGTILGDASVEDSYQGAAPGLGGQADLRFYNVKVGGDNCGAVSIDLANVLSRFENSVNDGTVTTPRPHVINHSWGNSLIGPYFGTEVDGRLLDSSSFLNDQLHVFSAGNFGNSGGQTLTLQASAKNVLSVGNVNTYLHATVGYPGNLWSGSSRGPTADLRWGPKICAPGTSIRSVQANTTSGYTLKTGTSMAAPHVTGIAAQLVDRYSFLRYRPATLSAVLMAGSLTKDNAILSSPSISSNHHYNLYGTGRVDAYKVAGGNGQQTMYFWGFNQGPSGFGSLDFSVGAGATQVTVVMNYQEFEGSAGASSPLQNDLDMYIDRAPFTAAGDSGEFFAQQSTRDTTEVRILNNPVATDYRVKVFPESTAPFANISHVGVCVIVTYGDVTPDLSVNMTTSDAYVKPNEDFDITVNVYNPSYIASAVFLEPGGLGSLNGVSGVLEDGSTVDYTQNNTNGTKVMLGNIRHASSRSATWDMSFASQGVKNISVTTSSDNAGIDTDSVNVTVDGTPPSGPISFFSTSHGSGFSCDTTLDLQWSAALDALSGLAGYRLQVDHSASTIPSSILNLSAGATTSSVGVSASNQPWYAHLRAQDRSGNWGTTIHAGPFTVGSSNPYVYCVGGINSTGFAGRILLSGTTSLSANNLTLRATLLPATVPCLFFYGPNEIQVPFGNGFRCVGGQIFRLPVQVTSAGVAERALNYGNLPEGGDILVGSTWKFQNWYRDVAGGGAGFNLTNGLSLTFCP